jgi:hypothetical protein
MRNLYSGKDSLPLLLHIWEAKETCQSCRLILNVRSLKYYTHEEGDVNYCINNSRARIAAWFSRGIIDTHTQYTFCNICIYKSRKCQ